ncbi:MAG: hypothetical protein WA667_02730 [Candidatus Nitrosopolaris sp.]
MIFLDTRYNTLHNVIKAAPDSGRYGPNIGSLVSLVPISFAFDVASIIDDRMYGIAIFTFSEASGRGDNPCMKKKLLHVGSWEAISDTWYKRADIQNVYLLSIGLKRRS